MNFMTELAANSSTRGVSWVIYSGNDDSQDAHRGSEGMCIALHARVNIHRVPLFLVTIQVSSRALESKKATLSLKGD